MQCLKAREFTIPGVPVGKARPRITRTHTYTPQKTKDYEELVKWEYKSQCKQPMIADKQPVEIEIWLYMYIPKNTSNIRREKKNNNEILPTKQPDWDNMAKAITDALNGLAFHDDNQIVDAIVHKRFSDNPRAEVKIREIELEGV